MRTRGTAPKQSLHAILSLPHSINQKPLHFMGGALSLKDTENYFNNILKSTTTARSFVTKTGLPSMAEISGISKTSC